MRNNINQNTGEVWLISRSSFLNALRHPRRSNCCKKKTKTERQNPPKKTRVLWVECFPSTITALTRIHQSWSTLLPCCVLMLLARCFFSKTMFYNALHPRNSIIKKGNRNLFFEANITHIHICTALCCNNVTAAAAALIWDNKNRFPPQCGAFKCIDYSQLN